MLVKNVWKVLQDGKIHKDFESSILLYLVTMRSANEVQVTDFLLIYIILQISMIILFKRSVYMGEMLPIYVLIRILWVSLLLLILLIIHLSKGQVLTG